MKNIFLLLLCLTTALSAQAQHDHHAGHAMPGMKKTGTDSTKAGMSMSDMDMHMTNYGLTMDTSMSGMTHSLSRNLPMNRNGSGTSWHPDNTPMYAYMTPTAPNGWTFMMHYAIYLRYTAQNSNNPDGRGRAQQFGAPNWFMGMAQRKVGRKGLFQARAMLSLDALTVGNGGYPLLFQTGESYQGRPLIDKQHPHDLVSELSVSYTHAFSRDIDLYGYLGYPGEPTVGPPVFMHRISAFGISDAPLSHHWQDATHITFGVATVGFRYKWAKLEASTFKGREPDENRYDFDRPRFDSYSYRLSVNPSPSLALQFSQGYIKSPEVLHGDEDVLRTTASILHSKGLGPQRYITSAFVYGLNGHIGDGHTSGRPENSFLAESSLQLDRVNFFGRYENVGKSAEELVLYNPTSSATDAFRTNPVLTINSLTLGMNYRLVQYKNTDLVLGAQTTLSMPDQLLQPVYGNMPISGQLYLRLSPSLMTMASMHTMHSTSRRSMHGMHH
ncbi:hypothetical protein CLV58_1513 [Spirosoma oryzae]|uniref:Uncharacterized protein n=1 Tax=Spirosoma oryzae TaxID=1469603 RepID=A0A2T0RJK7_9BACT|nr:hypothetical protein [Spirosoma oryzae]PRY21376.1 hypothetical protein CLV58_1513 [Spirosoma oryzae]